MGRAEALRILDDKKASIASKKKAWRILRDLTKPAPSDKGDYP